jgi:hypothetical protein
VIDYGTHIELEIGGAGLCSPGFIGIVVDALARFGPKPLLVVCHGATEGDGLIQAYDNGLELAAIARGRVAIVLGGREPTAAERLTELAAANRGAAVRSFPDLQTAKTWLAVD